MGRRRVSGFTLIELLVVIAVIALLIAILMPALSAARSTSRSAVCSSNLHQIGLVVATYSSEHNGYIPRGGDVNNYPSHQHWALLVLRKHGARPSGSGKDLLKSVNAEMAKREVFHCPERKAKSTTWPDIISYVVNAFTGDITDALNTGGGAGEQKQVTRETIWKQPGSIIYLADFELAEVSPYVAQQGTGTNTTNCADVYQVWSLPSAPPQGRRVARAMHSKRFTNSLFADSHAERVDSLPPGGGPEFDLDWEKGTYCRRWLTLFGVKLPPLPGS